MSNKNSKNNKKSKSKKHKLIRTFLKSVGITIATCVLIIAALGVGYRVFIYKGASGSGFSKNNKDNGKDNKELKSINKTIAIFGVDRDGDRTDIIFLVNFNSETNKARIVSMPRDTRVEWTEEQQQKLKELTGYNVSVSKLNEMSHYAGIENVREFTIKHIENLLGIKVDNYALVTIDAFRKIVDAIGGVEVNVPRPMKYSDPYQNLYIDLEPGVQVLDGEHAEMLVRFRKDHNGNGYKEGDVGRIKTQQLFLEAFAKKVMSPEIALRFPQIVATLASSVTTDIPLSEIPEYYSYAKNFDLSNLKFGILPGDGQYVGHVSYFLPDVSQIEPFVNELFFDQVPAGQEETSSVVDKAVTIEILNASGVTGAASQAKELLEKEGYTVGNIGNYSKEQLQQTKIIAKNLEKANQFKKQYPNATIEQNESIDYDIQILLGGVQQ